MQGLVLENMQVVPGQIGGPADVNGAAVTGDYVHLRNYERVLVLLFAKAGTATSGDLTVTLYQAKDVGGTGAKALNALQTGRIFTKQATALDAVGQWTKQTQDTAGNSFTSDTSGETTNLWALEVRASDLDVNGGFCCLRADIAATSSSKIASLLYLLADAKQGNAPELMPSAIA